MSWSIHRGLREILVTYAKRTIDKHRRTLASTLREFVLNHSTLFEANGWPAKCVRGTMADLAANSVLAGSGNSGDSVRVMTDIVLLLSGQAPGKKLDETQFWRKERYDAVEELSKDAIIALTKCFVLEWSIYFGHQMYHDHSPELLWR